MERILLASKTINFEDNRLSKRLLKSLYEKRIPGFCTFLADAMEMVGVENLESLQEESDERKAVKCRLVEVQKRRLAEAMMRGSKTDAMLLNFSYDGRMKNYLRQLPFQEGRIIFMLRARMFPTKCNFPNRWSTSKLCTFCCDKDTDEHLFKCCGYMDIHQYKISHKIFMCLDTELESLSYGAKILLRIHERLICINEDGDLNKDSKDG